MRTYRTSVVGDASAGDGMFGKGWRANFEYRIVGVGAAGVMLFDDAGRKIFYQHSDIAVVYSSPDGKGGTITRAADNSYLWQDVQGTLHQFDSSGYPLLVTDVHGNWEKFDYGPVAGRITKLTDRHGREVTFDYQETPYVKQLLGPMTSVNPTGVYADYDYDANGNLTRVTYPDGKAIIYAYEDSSLANHLTRVSLDGAQGLELQNRFQYEQGRMAAASEGPEGRSYRLAYTSELVPIDPAHLGLGQKTLFHTIVTEWTDTNWDFLINGSETELSQRTYSYENRGGADVVTKIEDGGCACAAEKEYDTAFHVVESKDNKGVKSRMTYNTRGDITSLTEAAETPDERITEYEYIYPPTELFPGQVLQKTTKRQSVVTPGAYHTSTEIFDEQTGRLKTRTDGDGTPLTLTEYTYTSSGAIEAIDGPRPGTIDRVTYSYYGSDSPYSGMLQKIAKPKDSVTEYFVTEFKEYDGLGHLMRKTDPNGRDTTYSYNSRGLLQAQTTVEGTTQYEYDDQGEIAKITYPRGNSVSYRHGQSRLTQVSDATGRIDFAYANGNKISESVYDAASALVKNTIYDYDDRNRLSRTNQASGDFEEFLYDENGNVTARSSTRPPCRQSRSRRPPRGTIF